MHEEVALDLCDARVVPRVAAGFRGLDMARVFFRKVRNRTLDVKDRCQVFIDTVSVFAS